MIKNHESKFLNRSFASLCELTAPYAVLRNAETLPDSLGGGDIDILVASGSMDRVMWCLADSAKFCGGKVMGVCRYPNFLQMMFLGVSEQGWWGCCIDLFEGVFCQGVLPIAGDNLLTRRVRTSKGVWTFDIETGQYLGFVKELITNGVISQRYLSGAKMSVEAGKDDFVLSESLRRFVKETLAGKHRSANVFRRKWLVTTLIWHPVYFLKRWCEFQLARLWRLACPCGKLVVVMGTDGAGKTTLLNEIMPVIRAMNHDATVVHHLKPDFLPPLGRLRGVKHAEGFVCNNPHGSKPSSFIGSLARIAYLTCDYLLGYWLKVRPKLAKTPIAYWIFDRYAYDMLIDPRRFTIRLPKWIVRMFLSLVPRPDLIICLGGNPERIYERKPETSLNEVRRQVTALKSFCMNHKNAVWVDSTASVEDSANQVLNAMLMRLPAKRMGYA